MLVPFLVAVVRVLAHSMQTEQTQLFTEFVVIGHGRAAFATSQVLRRVKREAGRVAEFSRPHAVAFAFNTMSGVLNDKQGMSIGNLTQSTHVAHLAVKMDR